MSDDELASFIRDNGITFPGQTYEPVPVPEPEPEDADEECWRDFRDRIERIREVRASRPGAAQLAMSADEITDYYQRPTLLPRSEAQRERDLKFVSRLKTGPKAKRDDDYRLLKGECVKACRGDMRRARTMFIKLAFERLDAHVHTAQNVWSLLKREDAK